MRPSCTWRWQTGGMGFLVRIQRCLGLDAVKVLDGYEKAPRAAHLTCRKCGVFVSAEGQSLHTGWHRAAGS